MVSVSISEVEHLERHLSHPNHTGHWETGIGTETDGLDLGLSKCVILLVV